MNEETDNNSVCPTCGAHISALAPGGLCPKCVLLGAQPVERTLNTPPLEDVVAAFPELEGLRLIGRGGMGAVFHALQTELNREIALKVLLPEVATDPAFAERFSREARALAKLNHTNIVSLFEYGKRDGLYFLSMEYVDGVNLRQAMEAGRFTPEQALSVIPGICDALEAAHNLGIHHRDIKPENILLDRDGQVKIVDFGIARMTGDPSSNFTLTEVGAVLGSSQYMAPEQLEQPHAIDHRADIYSLGVVFYEMLTGELPIGRFLPPSEKSDANSAIDKIVLRTLEKELDRRFQTVVQVKTEVQGANANPALKSVSTPADAACSRMIRGVPTFTFWVMILCVLGGLLAGIFSGVGGGRPHQVVVVAPIIVGLLLITAGYVGCWLALAAIRRGDINPRGRGGLKFVAVTTPLLVVGCVAACAAAHWFQQSGKGCIFWTIVVSAMPTCLVALGLVTMTEVKLGSNIRREVAGIVALFAIALLTFAFVKDGRWPFAHYMLRGDLTFNEVAPDEQELIRAAINRAVGEYPGRYQVRFVEKSDLIQITVLNSKRERRAAEKHIEAIALRLLDSLPATLVERTAFTFSPRRMGSDRYGIRQTLLLVGLLSALAGAGVGLLGGVLFELVCLRWSSSRAYFRSRPFLVRCRACPTLRGASSAVRVS